MELVGCDQSLIFYYLCHFYLITTIFCQINLMIIIIPPFHLSLTSTERIVVAKSGKLFTNPYEFYQDPCAQYKPSMQWYASNMFKVKIMITPLLACHIVKE